MPLRALVITACVLVALVGPTAAAASLTGEQDQGRALTAQLHSGAKRCSDLSPDDFDHLGEYVMARFLGSTVTHRAMNDRMQVMIGATGEQRMHQRIDERFGGCVAPDLGRGTGVGAGMMAGNAGSRGPGQMMSTGDWGWMMGANWRTMSRQEWQRLAQRWLGGASHTAQAGGPHGWAIAAIALATLLVTASALLALRGPLRRRMS